MRTLAGRIARALVATRRLWTNQGGMTILEVLVATLIGLFVVGAAMDAYLTLHSSTVIQDQINEMQQSGRAAMRVLSEQLRMAGFGLPATLGPLSGVNANPDTITITHMSVDGCEVTVSANMGSATDDIACGTEDLGCFAAGMRVYIYDPVNGVGEFFTIAAIGQGPSKLSHTQTLARAYPLGSRVSHVMQTAYYLDRSDSLHPVLVERQVGGTAQIYAENIEDLQFDYLLRDSTIVHTPGDPTLIRNVLVQLVARTASRDKSLEQDYHRREFSFRVSMRNLEE